MLRHRANYRYLPGADCYHAGACATVLGSDPLIPKKPVFRWTTGLKPVFRWNHKRAGRNQTSRESMSGFPGRSRRAWDVNLRPVEGQEVTSISLLVNWQYSEDALGHRPVIMLFDDNAKKWLSSPGFRNGAARPFPQRCGLPAGADDQRPAPFKDTAGHWADSSISKLASGGVLAGFPDGTLPARQPVTRRNSPMRWRFLKAGAESAVDFKTISPHGHGQP